MTTLYADSIPHVSITRHIDTESDTPSLHRFGISMAANDYALENDFLADETFARAEIVLIDPLRGNPTDNADAESQELFDVATAFYDPEGELSTRAMQQAAFHNEYFTPPLVYVENIHALAGFEKGGRIEAGLAIALRQIALDYGCESSEIPLMLAAYDKNTLFLHEGDHIYSDAPQGIDLTDSLKKALGLNDWVAPGQTFASEPGHGPAHGLILDEATKDIIGHEQTLKGNTLMGTGSFEFGFELELAKRSEKSIASWLARREAAVFGTKPEARAEPHPSASLSALAEAIADRKAGGGLSLDEHAAIRHIAQSLLDSLAEPDIGAKVKAKRGTKADGDAPTKPSADKKAP